MLGRSHELLYTFPSMRVKVGQGTADGSSLPFGKRCHRRRRINLRGQASACAAVRPHLARLYYQRGAFGNLYLRSSRIRFARAVRASRARTRPVHPLALYLRPASPFPRGERHQVATLPLALLSQRRAAMPFDTRAPPDHDAKGGASDGHLAPRHMTGLTSRSIRPHGSRPIPYIIPNLEFAYIHFS